MSYYDHINHGEKYNCDRCEVVELRADEYENNRMNGFIYCDECRNYVVLQRFKCIYCCKEWSNRSERILPLDCECGGLVVCLSK